VARTARSMKLLAMGWTIEDLFRAGAGFSVLSVPRPDCFFVGVKRPKLYARAYRFPRILLGIWVDFHSRIPVFVSCSNCTFREGYGVLDTQLG
jgi:hypothetical protein